jgi:hypothetical protein
MQESVFERGVDLRALLLYLAAAVVVGSLIAFLAPEQLLSLLPADPIWLRPAVVALAFAGILLSCVIAARRLGRGSQ